VTGIEKLTGREIPRIAIPGLDEVTAQDLADAALRKRGRAIYGY
jgi:hypothetical protein